MKPSIYVPLAIALGFAVTPLVAQPYPPSDRDRAMTEQDNGMRHHDMNHDRYMNHDRSMRHDSSYWRTMRWCRSMPYRRMMRIGRCRWLMHHSDRMDHRY